MAGIIRGSISNKLVLLVMATCFIALLIYGGAMLAFDLRGYQDSLLRDLRTQANIMADVNVAALEFDDHANASENLALLRNRPLILAAAVYNQKGARFATYAALPTLSDWPDKPLFEDSYNIESNRVTVWQRVTHNGELIGTLYLKARYEARERLFNYLIILVCVMAASLGLALLIAIWLRGALTRPIFAVTSVARHVMKTRDFSLRAPRYTDDEIGLLAEAFNDMLSEVERRASALRQADRRKDEFLATLAHELRNPLAPLSNGLHILRLSKDKPEVAEKAKVVMERQLNQMVRLVDDLLDVSRINTGKLTINKTRVDIQSVMRDAIESTGSFIDSCHHQLQVEMPPEPVYLDADPLRLAQVFSNLLNNAAKYTNPGGRIAFIATLEDDHLRVVVSDNGIGIAPHMLSDIFEMFTQIDQSLERAQAGLGVGLALAKHLAQLHGYELTVASDGPGKGSTFSMRLGILNDPAPVAEVPVATDQPRNCVYRILLADDNVDFVATMSTLLTTLGHEVLVAHNGSEALQVARDFKPDFAFLDIGMPAMNGHDLARHLRQTPGLESMILVAITGWGQETDRQLSRDAGFNHHLVKPVELAQILLLLDHDGPKRNS